jgi:hypothetical protein
MSCPLSMAMWFIHQFRGCKGLYGTDVMEDQNRFWQHFSRWSAKFLQFQDKFLIYITLKDFIIVNLCYIL